MTASSTAEICDRLVSFVPGHLADKAGDNRTRVSHIRCGTNRVARFENEFWTPAQRQGSSLHEISYRACFKPQLPRFFIELLTSPGETVYDPFCGRGTTPVEAGLLSREVITNDINPLSTILTRPRFTVPDTASVKERLESILDPAATRRDGLPKDAPDLSMFYHKETYNEILALRSYLLAGDHDGTMDDVDAWIRMVATNRLTGHSKGFFSVYTLPPNQAISPDRQRTINARRKQVAEYRDIKALIDKKSRSLVRNVMPRERSSLASIGSRACFLTCDARETPLIRDGTVSLTVTSPPFLDVVQYAKDNWLRCWFCGIDAEVIGKNITSSRTLPGWCSVMGDVFSELFRVTKPGGHVAFEVGEVRRGTIPLDEHIIPLGTNAGFSCTGVVINRQEFTKTANIWGVRNNEHGTNTNRIVLFRKE
jgi:hypothetical protein